MIPINEIIETAKHDRKYFAKYFLNIDLSNLDNDKRISICPRHLNKTLKSTSDDLNK